MPSINLTNPGIQQDFTADGGIPFNIQFQNSSGNFDTGTEAYLIIEFTAADPYFDVGAPNPRFRAKGVAYIGDQCYIVFRTAVTGVIKTANQHSASHSNLPFQLDFYIDPQSPDTINLEVQSDGLLFDNANYELIIIVPPAQGQTKCRKYRPLYGTITQTARHTSAGASKNIGQNCV